MRSRRTGFFAGAVVALLGTVAPDRAAADEFMVETCKGDRLNYSTGVFDDFATRGMKIRRACNPEGPGLRGMVISNVVRDARVRRDSFALLKISAPAATHFTRFRWSGTLRRRDCGYALQMWADGPGINPIPLHDVRANEHCPRPRLAQLAGWPRPREFSVAGATRIVQRVICVGGDNRKSCSARGLNYIQTHVAAVGIADLVPPTALILGDTPLARGEWVGGMQPLNYEASDNVGVRVAFAKASGYTGGDERRPCAFAVPEKTFAAQVPCPSGRGQITVDTSPLPDGTQPLVVQAQDTANNIADSSPVTARIDNSAPGRVDVSVEGGQEWRNTNDFALAWTNPPEGDRAPIAAATYKMCRVGPGSCNTGERSASGISRLAVQVPAPGEWTLSLWRRDAAGNQSETAASVPATLRYDPEPPQLGFEQPSGDDPTLVAVSVTDNVSGVAGGTIEISPTGSSTWLALATEQHGSRLVARIDDAALAAGGYQMRARAFDHAKNEASTDRRLDGQPMSVTLPLRNASSLRAGFERVRTVKRTVRRHGKRRIVRRRMTTLMRSAQVRSGGHATVAGRLVNRDGHGIAGAEIRVFSTSSNSQEQLIAVIVTDATGRFRYKAAGSTSRTLRFAYAGSTLMLPAARVIAMRVPALTSLDVDRRRVLNGQSVTFSGRLRTQPAPPSGKLVELQVRLSDRWQTFRTTRTDEAGRWTVRYRFKRTRGVQRFQFRARLPRESSYPFAAGGSRPLTVRVRGL
jgi:hypothetical protein